MTAAPEVNPVGCTGGTAPAVGECRPPTGAGAGLPLTPPVDHTKMGFRLKSGDLRQSIHEE